MKLLAIDCAASFCAACVYDAGAGIELGRHVLDLGKGHAEHLMAVIEAALKAGGIGYRELDAVGVSIGPGSFTGLRVGVSTARGLALALKIPAIGVTTLEALAAEAANAFPGRAVLAALDAGREELHAALFDKALVLAYGPAVANLSEATALAIDVTAVLAGTAAPQIAAAAGRDFDIGPVAATADVATYARLAAAKGRGEKPKPLYLRGADAKPQAGFILPRQDHDPKKWNPVFGKDHGPKEEDHDPKKWQPVFGRDHGQKEQDHDPKKREPVVGEDHGPKTQGQSSQRRDRRGKKS